MRGVFLDLDTYIPEDGHAEVLKPLLDEWEFHDATKPEQVAERIGSADLVVSNKVKITRADIEAAETLKIIIVGATGYDNIDVAAAKDAGVTVCNIVGYSTESVAQLVFGFILSLSQSIMPYHNLVKTGAWEKSAQFCLLDYPLTEIAGKTLGLIGYGDIAKSVERIALAFGMKVLVAERAGASEVREGRMVLSEMLPQVDVVSVHCPMTPQTKGLIGADELAAMKRTALVINCGRGGIVDEQALVDALRAGEIAGAAVDVLSKEPPSGGNPLLANDIPNFIVTPHCAWASYEARVRLFAQMAEIIEAYKAGNPMNVVS